jgi:hypothetical protein
LTLYHRPGCHLCDDAIEDLTRLRKRYPHTLTLIDISARADLEAEYGLRIPVLELAGRSYEAPLPYAVLERALLEAARGDSQVRPGSPGPEARFA